MTCRVCGRAPAATIKARRVIGLYIVARLSTIKAPLCREHGVETVRDSLRQTLIKGWWSITSLLIVNPVVIVLDLLQLRKVKKLPDAYMGTASYHEPVVEQAG